MFGEKRGIFIAANAVIPKTSTVNVRSNYLEGLPYILGWSPTAKPSYHIVTRKCPIVSGQIVKSEEGERYDERGSGSS